MRLIILSAVLCVAAFGAGAGERQTTKGARPGAGEPGSPAEIFARARRSTVTVYYVLAIGDRRERRRAMGIVISADGLVLTHGDLKRSGATLERLTVFLGERRGVEAKYLGKDRDLNLAVIRARVGSRRLTPFDLSAEARVAIGDPVYALTAMSQERDFRLQLEVGRIMQKVSSPFEAYATSLRPSAMDSGLDLGAPVLGSRGELIGVLTGATGFRKGLGIYPVRLWRKYALRPPADHGGDAWLGIVLQALSEDLRDYWRIPDRGGVVVSGVLPGSPGADAGLRTGDVLVRFDGEAIEVSRTQDVPGFIRVVKSRRIGSTVNVVLVRGRTRMTVPITLKTRPRESLAAQRLDLVKGYGLSVSELTFDILHALNLPRGTPGVIVTNVQQAGWAAEARLRLGDIIQRVGDRPAGKFQEFRKAIGHYNRLRPPYLQLFVLRGVDTRFVTMRPNWKDLD